MMIHKDTRCIKMKAVVRIIQGGRVTIPEEIRKILKLEEGQFIEIEVVRIIPDYNSLASDKHLFGSDDPSIYEERGDEICET